MFDRTKYDLQLHIAARKDAQLWVAHLESLATASRRSAARSGRPAENPAGMHSLLAYATVSALSGLSRAVHEKLMSAATREQAERPRLLLKADSSFIDALAGNGPLKKVGEGLRFKLRKRLELFQVTYERLSFDERTSTALLKFAYGALVQSTDGEQPMFDGPLYLPDCVSVVQPIRFNDAA